MKRKIIYVKGIVQGVGFRPFVYKQAKKRNLKGWVKNTGNGVIIDVEGIEEYIDALIEDLKTEPPELSDITEIITEDNEIIGYHKFEIKFSEEMESAITNISPDIALCEKCRLDIENKENRRYGYPFTNCTNCGPRLSIIKSLPYDRKVTTMDKFPMCDECKREYNNPEDRRFHAQPNACPVCGPKISILINNGEELPLDNNIEFIKEVLRNGKIIALKGLGGFHLVCNGLNSNSINTLRERKSRPSKPLAVMMKDIETVKKYCYINEVEEKIIIGNKKPILILKKKEANILPKELSNNKNLGVMLPYTPLHQLLFDDELNVLVMTSANRSGEPMVYTNESAINELKNIVDYFVVHNRDIYLPVDDSISRVVLNNERLIRPARGYAPITQKFRTKKRILGCGSQLKNTFSITNGDSLISSEYLGDMDNYKTYESFEKSYKHFTEIYNIKPEIIAHDLHPDYWCSNFVNVKDVVKIPVQHHHAHIASCLFENKINEEVIGVAFDGSGYGDDGHIWGGEFLLCNNINYKRVGHINYVSLPGGEGAIKEPWKVSVAYLVKTFKDKFIDYAPKEFNMQKSIILSKMINGNINSPLTSSMGRFFDGVAGLLGFTEKITYEGEAAIYLENIADVNSKESYKYSIDNIEDKLVVNTDNIIKSIIEDMENNIEKEIISRKFHNTIVEFTCEICCEIRSISKINKVALSGGVFANELLLENTTNKLTSLAFEVFSNNRIPTNDSGISVGQVVIAASRIEEES